jgi:hypothetical protein
MVEMRTVVGDERIPMAARLVPVLAFRRLRPVLEILVGLLVGCDEAGEYWQDWL